MQIYLQTKFITKKHNQSIQTNTFFCYGKLRKSGQRGEGGDTHLQFDEALKNVMIADYQNIP